MRNRLLKADFISSEDAKQIIFQCFEVAPPKDRLYQIRNDINRGNIRENSGVDYKPIYFRGMLLQTIVMKLLYAKLGRSISSGMSISQEAEQLNSPSCQDGKPPQSKSQRSMQRIGRYALLFDLVLGKSFSVSLVGSPAPTANAYCQLQ